jgi:FkbM family methyltransferase
MLVPQTKVDQFTVEFHNSEEFHLIKREVFTQRVYDFEFPALDQFSVLDDPAGTNSPPPLIVDAGAHIGLASLFFAKNYPQAKILALEPQATNFKLLKANIWHNKLEDRIEARQLALAAKTGPITLHVDTVWDWFSTASLHQGAWTGNQETKAITVEAISLTDLLNQLDRPIDLLKLDIEGAEQSILEAAGASLQQIRSMVIEFHPHRQQSAKSLNKLLEGAGFQVTFWQKGQPVDPHPKKTSGLMMVTALLE